MTRKNAPEVCGPRHTVAPNSLFDLASLLLIFLCVSVFCGGILVVCSPGVRVGTSPFVALDNR